MSLRMKRTDLFHTTKGALGDDFQDEVNWDYQLVRIHKETKKTQFILLTGEIMSKPCSYEYELWGPHEGCKEFMTEPEALIHCDTPPAFNVVAIDHYAAHFLGTPENPDTSPLFAAVYCSEHLPQSDQLMTILCIEDLIVP